MIFCLLICMNGIYDLLFTPLRSVSPRIVYSSKTSAVARVMLFYINK